MQLIENVILPTVFEDDLVSFANNVSFFCIVEGGTSWVAKQGEPWKSVDNLSRRYPPNLSNKRCWPVY